MNELDDLVGFLVRLQIRIALKTLPFFIIWDFSLVSIIPTFPAKKIKNQVVLCSNYAKAIFYNN